MSDFTSTPVGREATPFQGAKRAHVLIADDNEANRSVLISLCEAFDFTTHAVNDGVEAVRAFEDMAFDLILMDIQMPAMDGIEATVTIRRSGERGRTIPILAVTANVDPSDLRAYRAVGMNGFVAKPISAERMLEAIFLALNPGAGQAPLARSGGESKQPGHVLRKPLAR